MINQIKLNPKYQQGFHLIEVMIVLAIMALMSHFVLGQYKTLVVTEKRHLAETALYNLGSELEDYAMTHLTYEGATLAKLKINKVVAKNSYSLKIEQTNAREFLIAAYPLSQQALLDKRCGVLSLSSTGVKKSSGTASVTTCWGESTN